MEDLQRGALNRAEELSFFKKDTRVRNAINRVTFTTGGDGFDPFSIEEITFLYQPIIYVMFDRDSFTEKDIEDRLNEIGESGFGKKGSIGKGYFRAEIDKSFKGFDEVKSSHYLTISPNYTI